MKSIQKEKAQAMKHMNIYEETMQVWGIKSQIHKFSEELFELGVAMHHWYDDKATKMELATEIADVQIMCSQLALLVGQDLVHECKIEKITNLRRRVNLAKEEANSNRQ